MIKTKLGERVKGCLCGGAMVQRQTGGMWQKYGQKVKRWQNLAKKYQNDGLTQEEVTSLLDEMKDKKRQADLILELTVRSEDLKDASSEVRVFMDRLLEDLAVKYPPVTKIDFGLEGDKAGGKREQKLKATEDKRPVGIKLKEELGKIEGELVNEWTETLELALELRKWRDGLSKEEIALLAIRPRAILGFLNDYLKQGIERAKPRKNSPFQSLKIKIFGAD
jgi:hypothetical protein